ncbi:MAG: DNA repair protein RadC [Bacteroidales bacterium]|jgi:DNA repair protein RadC|nr:DNA repair protein RadC [Bacteroidales bacterium]
MEKKNINIKEWAPEDRPREKMMAKGVSALTEAELLAILVGSGSKEETAVELCRRILASYNNNLNTLGKQDLQTLMGYKGIGEAKAITIVAALELGRRRAKAEPGVNPRMTCSTEIYAQFHPMLGDLPHEEFWIMLLNNSLSVIHKEKIGQGGISETSADVRLIFKSAVSHLASGLVLCHNHPSGSMRPSVQDDRLTDNVHKATKLFGITLIDHLIVGDGKFYSYHDEGRI